MKLIMLGAPGAGKGTQAQILSEKFGIPSISTGAIIRGAIKNETPTGKLAKGYIDKGELVPDQVVIGIIKERLSEPDCKGGFILDGFPRTIPQAEALYAMGIEIDKVVDIEVDDDQIIKRLSGRRECPVCGATYHIENNPTKDGKTCDKCHAQLVTRKDDNPETIKSRLDVYHSQTEPLIEFYKGKGNLLEIDGGKTLSEATEDILKALSD
ncbi:MAG: adenylate kinase [Ruminococcaceae bacterium]|nr:adenylate kinase [Oscillospiraceae bacterium]